MNADQTAHELTSLTTRQLVARFTQLDAPTLEEMQGEYAARLLAQPFWLAGVLGQATLNNPLQHWLCKAFRPVDQAHGRGYNTFQQRGRVVQRYPMGTQLAPSRFDGQPALQLVYRHFHSLCGSVHMVDEVRRAAPGVYLGLGTYGFTDAQRRIPFPFLLTGPQGPYRGDIGSPRHHFQPGMREFPALTQS